MSHSSVTEGPRNRDGVASCPGVEVVRAAARRILRGLLRRNDQPASDSPSHHLLHDLDDYRACLEAVVRGEPPGEVAARLPPSANPLGELFRSRLLAMDEGGDPATVLEVLRGVEALRREGRAGRIPEPDPELKAWLTRPDAFELLVEVAHDLRSPLTSILFLSEAIRAGQSGKLNEVQKSQLGLIYSAALGLVSVTSNVVEMAKEEKALVDEEDAAAFSISDVLQGVVEMVNPMAEEKGVELRVVTPDHDRGYGHPAALSRILLNLVTNGLKFTEEGFVEMGVERLSHRALRFHVQDTGRGIPEPQLQQLFQPFRRRLRDDTYFFSGSGLGLSICQRLLKAMGSELKVETTQGDGTRFFFTLDASLTH